MTFDIFENASSPNPKETLSCYNKLSRFVDYKYFLFDFTKNT